MYGTTYSTSDMRFNKDIKACSFFAGRLHSTKIVQFANNRDKIRSLKLFSYNSDNYYDSKYSNNIENILS